ncbi:ABC transporter substrate-binding protein [Streptomyces sp. NBC_01381]|uniref:ABC transporter substrate-binding protein n=1 Tax=Streptomyces sp. NBC_01381 TaxID=2903845 RepID=UPI0022527B0D|nr:ABC transporter substrate-binding protein [Streptomyces sp. NBC_01381]MCX4670671.1 ABC transporter substrate-binding protein [Streptomyces sp. NBC_01381]
MMFNHPPKEWGPLEWLVAAVVVIALVAGAVTWNSSRPGPCGDGLEQIAGECVGVTDHAFDADEKTKSLIKAVADENARVEQGWENPSGGKARTPYVRIALMMPFTSDESSAMTGDMIRRALAGAHAAQLEANSASGPHYQLLFAPDGKDLSEWKPVVDRLAELTRDTRAPLVGVTGIPSSTTETREAVAELTRRGIPTVGPVITAASMNSRYFFKTSPNNEQFAKALTRYLDRYPQEKKGLLLWDSREGDVYSQNLREVFDRHFGKTYDLKNHNSHYIGSSGDDQGIPRRFADAVARICRDKADTVFFAGRDQDLPAFINRLAHEGGCDRGGGKLRILKVGIGLEPTLTSADAARSLHRANATIVDASAYDPAWAKATGEAPSGFSPFLARFKKIDSEHELGAEPLKDGYAAMYHDGFALLASAVDRTYGEINEGGAHTPDPALLPSTKDVYSTLTISTINGGACTGCLVGAGGTYGFTGPGENNQWAVCKPVPIIEFPPVARSDDKEKLPLYRTYRGDKAKSCPS